MANLIERQALKEGLDLYKRERQLERERVRVTLKFHRRLNAGASEESVEKYNSAAIGASESGRWVERDVNSALARAGARGTLRRAQIDLERAARPDDDDLQKRAEGSGRA